MQLYNLGTSQLTTVDRDVKDGGIGPYPFVLPFLHSSLWLQFQPQPMSDQKSETYWIIWSRLREKDHFHCFRIKTSVNQHHPEPGRHLACWASNFRCSICHMQKIPTHCIKSVTPITKIKRSLPCLTFCNFIPHHNTPAYSKWR